MANPIIGHEWAVNLFRNHVKTGRIRQAYLITGPDGVGKRTLALRMAQILNCSSPPEMDAPCGQCRDCMQTTAMRHPDLTLTQPESAGKMIRVEQIRELQRSLILAPYQGRYRVALITGFEAANPNAANALLKTLEEPPSQVIMILTAEDADMLLPTIVSRCELIRLRPAPVNLIQEWLQTAHGLTSEQAAVFAHVSNGRPGYALYLHQNPEARGQRSSWLDDQQKMLGASLVDRFSYAEGLAKDKQTFRGLLLVWISFWRDVMLRISGSSTPPANYDRVDDIERIAAQVSLSSARRIVTGMERMFKLTDTNTNTRLIAEVLLMDLPEMGASWK